MLAHLPLGSNVWDATSCITPLEYGSSTNVETLKFPLGKIPSANGGSDYPPAQAHCSCSHAGGSWLQMNISASEIFWKLSCLFIKLWALWFMVFLVLHQDPQIWITHLWLCTLTISCTHLWCGFFNWTHIWICTSSITMSTFVLNPLAVLLGWPWFSGFAGLVDLERQPPWQCKSVWARCWTRCPFGTQPSSSWWGRWDECSC